MAWCWGTQKPGPYFHMLTPVTFLGGVSTSHTGRLSLWDPGEGSGRPSVRAAYPQ